MRCLGEDETEWDRVRVDFCILGSSNVFLHAKSFSNFSLPGLTYPRGLSNFAARDYSLYLAALIL